MWYLADVAGYVGGAGDELRVAAAEISRISARLASRTVSASLGGPMSTERSEYELLVLSMRGRGPVKGRGSSRERLREVRERVMGDC